MRQRNKWLSCLNKRPADCTKAWFVDQEKAHKEFGFTSDFGIATAVAIGRYGGDPDQLSEDLKEQELEKMRERKKLEEFAFNGNFQSK